MNINFDKNREVMIENQLRPNKITDITILETFNKVSKEKFISEDKMNICYSDQDILVKDSRGYLKNLHLAQILYFSEILLAIVSLGSQIEDNTPNSKKFLTRFLPQ